MVPAPGVQMWYKWGDLYPLKAPFSPELAGPKRTLVLQVGCSLAPRLPGRHSVTSGF